MNAPAGSDPLDGFVAVVGMGIAVPGASGPEEFWDVLTGDADQFSEPADRFDLDHFWSADPHAEDRTYARTSGYLHRFRPHPALRAEEDNGNLAPGQEARWLRHCLLQALDGVRRLPGDRCGVYVGAWPGGSQSLVESMITAAAQRALPEAAVRILRDHYRHRVPNLRSGLPDGIVRAAVGDLAHPLSELLVVDTACSSSLYAVDLGAKALLAGACEVSYCGGVFALDPAMVVMFGKLGGLSRTGRVRAFDERADGTLFSDGAGIVVLKRLSRAVADGDHVLGVLTGFGASADGRGKSISAPNPAGQERAVQRARQDRGVTPEQIDWVIAHGTGTPVGDPVELGILASLAPPCGYLCSGNKSLIGHTGWSAGVVSLIHALLALQHESVPAQHGLSTPVTRAGTRVPSQAVPFPIRADRPRTVGISAFGFGGTNAHLLVSDRPDRDYSAAQLPSSGPPPREDALVLVAWTAHLPGTPDHLAVQAWLRGTGAAPPRSFGPTYPLPSPTEVRLSARTLQAIDLCQIMALQVAARFTDEHGALWENLREHTGVIAVHMGIPRVLAATALRCYAEDMTRTLREAAVADDTIRAALDHWLADISAATPPTSEDTQAGVLPNVIASRIAARLDLHGATFAVDAGLDGMQAALRAAHSYLQTGELELALILAVNGTSSLETAEATGIPQKILAEGAFLLAVAGESTAHARDWPILARINSLNVPNTSTSDDAGYLGAQGAVQLLRAAEKQQPSSQEPLTSRYLLALAPAPAIAHQITDQPPLPPGGIVLLDDSPLPVELRSALERSESAIVTTGHDSAIPGALVIENLNAANTDSRLTEFIKNAAPHITVLADLRRPTTHSIPRPTPSLLTLHDLTFLVVQRLPKDHRTRSSLAVLIAGHPATGVVHPHAALFTGFVKSLSWERPGTKALVLLTNLPLSSNSLGSLSSERATDIATPVVERAGNARNMEVLIPTPLHNLPPISLPEDAVVLVTGGAGGVPSALLHSLAEHIQPNIRLLGRTPLEELPAELQGPETDPRQLRTRLLRRLQQQTPDSPIRELVRRTEELLRARAVRVAVDGLRDRFGVDRVQYHICDLLDPQAVATTVAKILAADGKVDLLIHAAGLFRPSTVENKTLTSFRQVRDTKVLGYHNLKTAFGEQAPTQWCNIGSYAGIAGLPGDTDYAAANAYLNAAGALPTPAEHTVAFTLWRDAGLGAEPTLQALLNRKGLLTPVPTGEATGQFLSELRSARINPGTVSYLGDRERQMLHKARPGFIRDPRSDNRGDTAVAPWANGNARWERRFTSATDSFLLDHLVDSKPTLPGTFMLEIAARAAENLVSGLVTSGFRNVRFEAFVRPFTTTRPFVLRIEAEQIEPAEASSGSTGPVRVRVALRSDLIGPDGALRLGARLHFHGDVLLQRPGTQSGRVQLPQRTGETAPDPYYTADSRVRLSGAFNNTADGRWTERSASTLWTPGSLDEPFLRSMTIPALLICSTLRTAALRPINPGIQQVYVPRGLAQLDLYTEGANDRDLLTRYGSTLILEQDPDSTFRAIAPDGRVLLEIIDADLVSMGTVGNHQP